MPNLGWTPARGTLEELAEEGLIRAGPGQRL